MNRKDVINFAPTGEKKRKKVPSYVIFIVGICLTAFVVSVFVILAVNDFDLRKALGARLPDESLSEATTEAELTDTVSTEEAQAVNFLVLCSDERELTFVELISVDASSGKIRIKPVSPGYTLDFESGSKSVAQAFTSESINSVMEAFSLKGIDVKKYVHVTEDNFKKLMSKLGAVQVQIMGNYEFNVDAVKYTFTAGTQNMTSDMLLKYMKYAESGEAALRLQGYAVAAVFRQHFSMENFSKGEAFFSALINLVETNITAFDYSAATGVLSSMLSGSTEVTVVS